ncbi:MAG: glycosyltransferase [Verrucomicrobiae bacterium]|nr:glycosyltransferase [Verrucomicrobiae bacterium]
MAADAERRGDRPDRNRGRPAARTARLFPDVHPSPAFVKISVITVCRNAAGTIRDCIDSVAAQTHPDVEHWIIDGASTDGTAALLAELQKDRGFQFVSEPDGGLYHAMNKGLAKATGDVIGFLNADDWYASPNVLAEVAEALSDPAVAACYANLQYVRQDDPGRVVRDWIAGPFEAGAFFRGWMPPHPTFFARREVYQRWGGFDTRYRFGADWELLFRLFEVAKIPVAYVPRHWITMRLGGETNRSLRNILTNHRECLSAFRQHGFRVGWIFPIRKVAHRLRQFRWRRPRN